ncbi:MAG: IS110 family transposase, partial [Bacillota bacterium]
MQKAQKLGLVYGNVLVVGVDVAKKNHFARIHNQMGLDAVKPFRFHNNKEGFYRLLSRICEAQSKEGTGRVVVGMEPTGHYWKPLARFLHDHGYTVVIVNPYHGVVAQDMLDFFRDEENAAPGRPDIEQSPVNVFCGGDVISCGGSI